MAWAVQTTTRRATHISMLRREDTGLNCACVCGTCGGILQAVNPGKSADEYLKPNTLRPFFRHHTGQQHTECLLGAARLAALQLLFERDEIDLPAPKATHRVAGVSGSIYAGLAEGQPLRAGIASREWIDEHAARLTLDDGRVVVLQLRSRTRVDDGVHAVVIIDIDDPEVATWPAEKILASAQLLGGWLCWSRHWDDESLQERAQARAEQQARELCDLLPEGLALSGVLTPLQRSESVLHWVIKELLAEAGHVRVPGCSAVVEHKLPDGQRLTRSVALPATTLQLDDVRLEHHLGDIVPDVVCRATDRSGRHGAMDLIIEVAVTHRVDDTKLLRIRQRGLSCLELDTALLRQAGQRIKRHELRAAVVSDSQNKRWVHHPRFDLLKDDAERQLAELVEEQRRAQQEQERKDGRFLLLPKPEALEAYLGLLIDEWGGSAGSSADRSTAAVLLQRKGIQHAGDEALCARGGVLWQLHSIRDAAARAKKRVALGVAQSVFRATAERQRFITYALIAIKVYRPPLTTDESTALDSIREVVRASIGDGDLTYARPTIYDDVVTSLFPELANELREKKAGTIVYAQRIQGERLKARRRAEEEQWRAQEAERDAQRRQEEEAERAGEIAAAIGDVLARRRWTAARGIPFAKEVAQRLLRRHVRMPDARAADLVARAWDARSAEVPLGQFLRESRPHDGPDVYRMATMLAYAWLVESVA